MKRWQTWPFRRLFDRGVDRTSGDAASTASNLADQNLLHQANHQFHLRRREIETSIDDPPVARTFMDRVIAQWQALGESDPFWSNDTRDEFRQEKLTPAAIENFYAGGAGAQSVIDAFESRSRVEVPRGICLELGCGVGKHTHVLARQFEHVFAVDVAAKGLALCDRHMKDVGIGNVTTVLLTSPADLARCGDIDLFFCLSVLQHNPPPLQRMLLDQALARVKPRGFCLFQTPDWIENYSFSTGAFLNEADALFDLHCLPKTDVLDILADNAMRLLDFAPDFTIGTFGSYTYFAQKATDAKARGHRLP